MMHSPLALLAAVLASVALAAQSAKTITTLDFVADNLRAGQSLLSEGHDPEAMDRFESVLNVDALNAEARSGELAAATSLALSADRAGHSELALQVLEHARTKLPDDPKLLFALGSEAFQAQVLPEASEALIQARKLRPDDLDILYMLARVEIEEQHLPAAEASLRAYLAVRSGDASAHFGLGHVLAMQQRSDEARVEFQRSIDLQPVQTESYYEIGQLELDVHHDAQAGPLFRKTLERDSKHGGALTGMGILAFRNKDFSRAEGFLMAAVKAAPEYPPAHYYYGLVLLRLGKKDEADRELLRATELGHLQSLVPVGAPAASEAPGNP